MRWSIKFGGAILLAMQCLAAQAQAPARIEFLEQSKGWGAVVADFDGDGRDDIFVSGHDTDDRIWYATPTGYIPAPQPFKWVDRHDCAAADINRDGLLDLYCAVGAVQGTGLSPKEVRIQQSNGRFALVPNTGAEDPPGRGRHVVFFDFNKDGYPDIYLTNQATVRPDGLPNYNHVFVNQAGRRYVEARTLATGARGFQCARKGDINGDGWDDLLVCSESGPANVYLNDQSGDFDALASPAIGLEWRDAQLVDVNGDGRDDLVLVNDRNVFQIWLNSGAPPFFESPAFEELLQAKGVSVAVGNFAGDERKDVYVVLQDANCAVSGRDQAPDIIFQGQADGSWSRVALQQNFAGCGHLAATVDGTRILLENGNPGTKGPHYVLDFSP